MTEIASLARVRQALRLDPGDSSEDEYLAALTKAALRTVENETGRQVQSGSPSIMEADLAVVEVAVLMLVGHWFKHREAVAQGSPTTVPLAFTDILLPLKRWAL